MDIDKEYTTCIRAIIWTYNGCLPMKHVIYRWTFKNKCYINVNMLQKKAQFINKRKSKRNCSDIVVAIAYLHCMRLVGLSANPWAPSIFSLKPLLQVSEIEITKSKDIWGYCRRRKINLQDTLQILGSGCILIEEIIKCMYGGMRGGNEEEVPEFFWTDESGHRINSTKKKKNGLKWIRIKEF